MGWHEQREFTFLMIEVQKQVVFFFIAAVFFKRNSQENLIYILFTDTSKMSSGWNKI